MNLQRIDHTAIVVRDLDEALARYRRVLGVTASERVTVPSQGVEVAFLPIGDTQLELISPIDSQSGVARFLERRGEGLHHVALRVADIRSQLQTLEQTGVELIDREPRDGVHGLIAFVHPHALGFLVELIEEPHLLHLEP